MLFDVVISNKQEKQMSRLKLYIEYDDARYSGWQIDRTAQEFNIEVSAAI